MSMLPLLLCLLVSLTSVLVAPEAFFRPPAGWREKRPGEVLRSRTVHPQLFDKGPVNVTAHQVLYRTSGTAPSEASHTVTTVLVPEQPLKDQLVLFAPEEDSVSATCAPSAMVASPWEGVSEFVADSLTELLKRGYTVTMPDFEGPNSAFGAGRLGGHMSLDGVRATLAAGVAPLSRQSKVVGYGYSGGSVPVGWALGGTVADVGTLMQYQDDGTFSGYALTDIAGLRAAYPELARALRSRLTRKGEEALRYDTAFIDVFRTLVLGARRQETPIAPVFMFHVLRDITVPYGQARRAARHWAAYGANVTLLTNVHPNAQHQTEDVATLPRLMQFLRERFEGRPFPKGLTLRNVSCVEQCAA